MMNEQRTGNKCVTCGKEIEEGARICPFCGAMQEKHFGGQSSGTSYGSFNTDFNNRRMAAEMIKAERKRKSRIETAIVGGFALVIIIICCVAYFSSYHDCGENATWEISGNTLTISGEGEMSNSQGNYKSKSDEIEKVIIRDGITSIGDGAFEGLDHLTSVSLGKDVKSIGDSAFWGCTELEKVTCQSFEVWENIDVSDSGNGALNSCVYFADGTHLIRSLSLHEGDEYTIEDETGISTGSWDLLSYTTMYNCLSFDLQVQLSDVSKGDPYGTFDIYILDWNVLKQDESYKKVSSMDIPDTSAVTKRVEFEQAQAVKGVTIIPKTVGDLEYRCSIQMLNVIVKD